MRKFSKAVERVDVRRFAVAAHGLGVENDTFKGRTSDFVYIATRT